MKYVLGAKCVKCGREYPAAPGLTTCACGGILDIVYDYAAIRRDWAPLCMLEMTIDHMTGKEAIELVKAKETK